MSITPDTMIEEMLAKELSKAVGEPAASPTKPKRKAKKPEAEFTTTKVELDPDTIMFSTILGYEPEFGDQPATILKKDDIDPELHSYIEQPDPNYVPQKGVAEYALLALEIGQNCFMSGKPGTGKSSLARWLCAKTARPFVRINGRGDLETSSMLGMVGLEGDSTVWHDGLIPPAVRSGGVVLWDEPSATPAEISLALQRVLERGGDLMLDDKPGDKLVARHKQFRMICADNTKGTGDVNGRHAGTAPLNSATMNRMGIKIEVGYMDKDSEASLLQRFAPTMSESAISKLLQLAALVRKGYDEDQLDAAFSVRNLEDIVEMGEHIGIKRALRVNYFNGLDSDTQQQEFAGYYTTVYGEKF